MFRLNRVVGVVCAAGLALSAGRASADYITFTPIALTGTSGILGPNMPSGVDTFVGSLGGAQPVMNNLGQVIFRSETNVPNTPGVWLYSGGNNNNIALYAGAALGGGTHNLTQSRAGVTPLGFGQLNLNDNTDYTFRENAAGSGPSRIFSSAGVTPGQLASTSLTASPFTADGTASVAPGTGGSVFSAFTTSPNQYLNSAGNMLFFGNLVTTAGNPGGAVSANGAGVWMGKPGSLSLVARQGDLTGLTPVTVGQNVLLGTFGTGAAWNSASKMVGLASLTGSITAGAAAGNDQALMSNRNGGGPVSAWETIARRGDAPPDENGVPFANGLQYRAITATNAINNAGRVAFMSTLRGAPTGTNTSYAALFTDTSGTMKANARTGTPLPASTGLAGLNWNGFHSNITMNSGGTVVFTSSLTDADTGSGPSVTSGVNDSALFKLAPDGTITTLYRTPATYGESGHITQNANLLPGEFARLTLANLNIAMNSSGQMAFVSSIASSLGSGGGSLTPAQRSGLFFMDTDGSIDLIAQPGTLFEVAPGDLRLVSSGLISLGSTGGQDGRPIQFNDNGDLVFGLNFDVTPGNPNATAASSGIFVVHIPTPGAGSLLGLAGLAAARRRRR